LKIVEKYKWDEWKKLGKMSKEEAMKAYVQALTEKVPTWNQNPKL
jgi:acyl-CoA-binding protein